MNYITILGIAIGLSMDALAIAVVNGGIIKKIKIRHAFFIAFSFGFFQFLMPIIGWLAGLTIAQYVKRFDHWVACAILLFIGGKMIYEAVQMEKEQEEKNCLHFPTLIIMSLATSIDALAVGFSFAALKLTLWIPVIIIGIVTFLLCFLGIYLGKKFGRFFEDKIEIAGGVILILIGLKIAIQHLVGNI